MLILIALSRLLIMVLFVTLLPNVSPKRRSHKTTNDKIWDDGYVESYENPSTSIMPLFSPCTFPIHPAAASQQIPNSEMQFSWQLDTELEVWILKIFKYQAFISAKVLRQQFS